jgi:hypothetical protein
MGLGDFGARVLRPSIGNIKRFLDPAAEGDFAALRAAGVLHQERSKPVLLNSYSKSPTPKAYQRDGR